ncbi:MAG: PSD1 and planctomycete cytochrome C domain-containing protein [Bryobacter sp.]|nr:PSD1 and planctomycete cytochrome C domain-containing protein [Bryobacter sp.]
MPVLLILFALSAMAQGQPADSPDYFESKVRPLFASNCYACHTNTAMGGLRVDSLEALLKGGAKHGPAVVPGDPAKSSLIKAISHEDPDPKFRMPMGRKMKAEEIEVLTAWVKAGAVWPKAATPTTTKNDGKFIIHPEQRRFWSFLPLQQPAPPTPKNAKWAKTNIDRFVLAKLEKEGMQPVAAASKRDLIRRAYLDLTGLPPTFEEVQAFELDKSPNAFEKVVDKLLASPHYGERWGRYWLDVARYGEDDYRSLDPMRRGYNPYPNAHVYRDWVIQAFNDDMPYDLFVKSQLAGDLLDPKLRHKTLAGTGFLGLGPWYYDNGSTEVTRADERHDRVDVITRGFLGLTVACARCHDHKYDPIPQSDYYAISGIFANVTYEEYPLAPKSVVDEFRKIEAQIDSKNKILGEMQQAQSKALAQSLVLHTSNYLEAVYEVEGKQKKDKFQVVDARKLDYEVLDRWIRYMGRETNKYKYKEAWQAMMKKGGTPAEAKRLATKFQEDIVAIMLERNELDKENEVIRAKALEGTKPKKRTNKPSNFVTNDDFCPGCGLQLKSMTEEQTNFWTEIFQRELADSDDPNAMMAGGFRNMKPGVLAFRGWGLESRIGSEANAQMEAVRKDIAAARKKLEPYYPYLHGVKENEKISNIPLNLRGDPFNLGPEVPRAFLSVLSKGDPVPFKQGSGRLELAENILSQPLATRVLVNRIWKGHFGTGIVDTPSNFGTTGERPTNPELLEYLAAKFESDGRSIKKLHREIMLSTVYQLSSTNNAANFAKDSANRNYWRFDRKRMDAEQIRDSVMLVSGLLDPGIGGPSADLKPSFHRRTVYGKVSRYKLDEYLQLFDFPSPAISAEKRFTTTVPLQRLFLLNSDFMQIQAEALAKRIAAEADNRARIRKLYQLTFAREPLEKEVQLGLEYLRTEPELTYEERKKREAEKEAEKAKEAAKAKEMNKGKEKPAADAPANTLLTKAPMPKGMPMPLAEETAPAATPMGMGMMAGVPGMGRPGPKEEEIKYEPTIWGRYAKVLLSSSEFLFIN